MSLDEVVRSGQDYKDSSDDSTTKETQVAAETPRPTFEFPPHVAETVLQRIGYQSLNEYEQDRDKSLAASTTTAGCCSSATQTRDPREKLREQIQEFLITSDDEETQD
ncbi:hypothetical protein BGW38_004506 [Lunasporangiospora selenospora]|uniref:Uncharacterized protein n=1 Tax=Lunasporangiospora selenospora TaxID=979761 RepID=A0A9P6KC39_9FUNG|nr:hypothetical protein BGW38_004506 [Lunasporangiospora selenospora]